MDLGPPEKDINDHPALRVAKTGFRFFNDLTFGGGYKVANAVIKCPDPDKKTDMGYMALRMAVIAPVTAVSATVATLSMPVKYAIIGKIALAMAAGSVGVVAGTALTAGVFTAGMVAGWFACGVLARSTYRFVESGYPLWAKFDAAMDRQFGPGWDHVKDQAIGLYRSCAQAVDDIKKKSMDYCKKTFDRLTGKKEEPVSIPAPLPQSGALQGKSLVADFDVAAVKPPANDDISPVIPAVRPRSGPPI